MAQAVPIPTDHRFKDLTGQPFGWLTVLHYCGRKGRHFLWECRCECGKSKITTGEYLRSGDTTSCGCHRGTPTHRLSGTRIYHAWENMRQRCTNAKSPYWPYYGGRGITVCERWQNDFTAFLADMGQPPTDKHTLDRIDNNGNYEPGNCRWATRKEQAQNTRQNQNITFQGRTQNIRGWSVELGIPYTTIRHRLFTMQLPPEKALASRRL